MIIIKKDEQRNRLNVKKEKKSFSRLTLKIALTWLTTGRKVQEQIISLGRMRGSHTFFHILRNPG